MRRCGLTGLCVLQGPPRDGSNEVPIHPAVCLHTLEVFPNRRLTGHRRWSQVPEVLATNAVTGAKG